jgi:hypothetical protein
MKKLAFIFVLGFVSNAFTQVIKINVTEVVDIYEDDSIRSINELISNDKLLQIKRQVNGTYEIDLTHKQFKFYVNHNLEFEGALVFSNSGNLYTINFLINGFNTGLLINMNIRDEHITWFSLFSSYKEVSKFTKFEIVKGL